MSNRGRPRSSIDKVSSRSNRRRTQEVVDNEFDEWANIISVRDGGIPSTSSSSPNNPIPSTVSPYLFDISSSSDVPESSFISNTPPPSSNAVSSVSVCLPPEPPNQVVPDDSLFEFLEEDWDSEMFMPIDSDDSSDESLSDGELEGVEEVLSAEDARNLAFRQDLVTLALDHNMTHECLTDTLKLLNKYEVAKLPICAKTLLKTPVRVKTRDVPPGLYWHNGFIKHLKQYLLINPSCDRVDVEASVDGVPPFKSTACHVYLITCSFNGSSTVCLIGAFVGPKSPTDSNLFLKDFIEEIAPQRVLCSALLHTTLTLAAQSVLWKGNGSTIG
ncbi:hypothetical protein ONE63_011463 [Megalurothrips usitatus]|uniref:Uncharacterized protein n=1 Tax=Megalurothrips usitatus TaxID=439358 RepID=A0AAV7X2C8_9NEOP|nr:hypothetical protein ONE63_011463 [Megalurothrips usitatus]